MILDPLAGLVEHGQRKVVQARFVGKIVVDRAFGRLRDRLPPEPRSVVPLIETIAMSTAEDPAPSSAPPAAPSPTDADHGDAPERDELVLPDYDHLPAAHVVSKLASLTPKERAAIERYELAHRHRRTILGKIDQLRQS
jgi:hypothetical protein